MAAPDEFFIYIPAVDTPETAIGPFGSGDTAPIFKLRGFTGVADTFIQPQTEKHPFQIGETFLNTDTTPRIITIFLRVIPGAFGSTSFYLRNFMARSMMVEQITPREPGDKPRLGFLRYFREGFIPVQLPVIPRSSPRITFIGRPDKVFDAELEFFAPFPYWENITTNTVTFTHDPVLDTDNLQFPLEFPFEFALVTQDVSTTINIVNTGDVRTPITVLVTGLIESGFGLINNTTGDRIDITGELPQGNSIRIITEFGQKSVTLIASDNTETNAMSRVNFETTIFWELAKGTNSVTFEAFNAGNTSMATLTYKNRFAGV